MSNGNSAAAPAARSEMRAPLRTEERARTRRRKGDQDQFYVDPAIIPDGQSWEWKRKSVFGKEENFYQMSLADNGWLPVDAKSFPQLALQGQTGAIEREGMVLMERPVELTKEAEDEAYQKAVGTVRDNERALQLAPTGVPRPNDPRARASITKSVEAVVIPD